MPSPDESNIEPKEIARARILALIKDNEITDIEFEVSMGLKPTTVSNWKRKGSASFIDNLPKIAQYFGVTTDWLLGNEVNEAAIDFRHDYFAALNGIKDDKDYPKLIRENQKKIDNILTALESFPQSSTLVDKLKVLELEKKQLESELSFAANPYIEADVIINAIPIIVKDALDILHNPYTTDERKNAILKSFVNRIEIQKDGTAKIQYHLPVVENSSQNILRPRSTNFQFRNYVSNINRY